MQRKNIQKKRRKKKRRCRPQNCSMVTHSSQYTMHWSQGESHSLLQLLHGHHPGYFNGAFLPRVVMDAFCREAARGSVREPSERHPRRRCHRGPKFQTREKTIRFLDIVQQQHWQPPTATVADMHIFVCEFSPALIWN